MLIAIVIATTSADTIAELRKNVRYVGVVSSSTLSYERNCYHGFPLAMDVSNPLEAMLPTVDSAVLSVLAGSTKPRTGREIARLASRSQPAVQKVLDRLVEQGLVHQEEAGRSRVYRLNRDHIAAPAIQELANIRSELFRRLRDAIGQWAASPVHASVFGSAARGDGTKESDIDIFLVRPKDTAEDDPVWRDQLHQLAEAVHAWTGNHAGIAEVSEQDLVRLKKEQPPVIAEVKSDAIELSGKKIPELLPRR
jgi:DNA-binding transcriptional ArsR family regulator